MMHVLDLDLDLFLTDCCPLSPPGERPALAGHEPWQEEDVRFFLEECCGLSRHAPLPGRVFDTHDKELLFWQERIAAGQLTAPFSVTHCDAHSDLGIGFPGPGAVLNGVLPVRFPERTDTAAYYRRKQLDEANYLLFALAFRYVASLENVRDPFSRADMPPGLLTADGAYLHLASPVASLMEPVNGPEPYIPNREWRDPTLYRASARFDLITLAQSPRYAPAEADRLIEVIRDYMKEE